MMMSTFKIVKENPMIEDGNFEKKKQCFCQTGETLGDWMRQEAYMAMDNQLWKSATRFFQI